MSWDPELYQRFRNERSQPFHDLLARIPKRHYRRITDLGCGTGEHTAHLAAMFPRASVVGLDSSPEMLQRAPRQGRNLVFRIGDIQTWAPDTPVDLIVSNAALHWLPNHRSLIPRLTSELSQEGVLAMQVPANHDAPSHRAVATIASDPRWADRVTPLLAPESVLALDEYERVAAASKNTVHVWDTVYEHQLPSAAAIAQWLAGTTIRRALDALAPSEAQEFLARLSKALGDAYGTDAPIAFPFRRRFVIAYDATD